MKRPLDFITNVHKTYLHVKLHSVFFIFSLHQTYFDQSDTLQTNLSLVLTMQTMKECIPYVLEGWNTSGHNVTSRIRIIQTFF